MKRFISILLVSALLVALAVSASAAVVDPVEPCFNYIRSDALTFRVDESTGIAYCYARCTASSGMTIKIVGTLQQYKNGGWSNVNSWTSIGTTFITLDKQWAVYNGYQYRFYARFYIYDSDGNFLESDFQVRTYDYT